MLGVIEPNVSVWQEEGALCVERVVVFHIPQLLIPDLCHLEHWMHRAVNRFIHLQTSSLQFKTLQSTSSSFCPVE